MGVRGMEELLTAKIAKKKSRKGREEHPVRARCPHDSWQDAGAPAVELVGEAGAGKLGEAPDGVGEQESEDGGEDDGALSGFEQVGGDAGDEDEQEG